MRGVAAALVLSGLVALSAAGAGQPLFMEAPESSSGSVVKVGADCTGGIRYDDGDFEYGFGFRIPPAEGRYVSEFRLPASVNRIEAVCLCLGHAQESLQDSFSGAIEVWSATGPGGTPGTLLGSFPASFTGVPLLTRSGAFYRVDLPQGLVVSGDKVFIGLSWLTASDEESSLRICADDSESDPTRSYLQGDESPWLPVGEQLPASLLGIRAETTDVSPPDGPWLTTPALPKFRFKVRITSGSQQIAGSLEPDCVPETLCVSGAVRGRSEVFVRIIGPRPNGFLWPSITKFTVSQVEIWIEQTATNRLRYYRLPAQGPADMSLPGLVDREGFQP